jgi:hypothetical protein
MGERPAGTSLDRIDNDGDYEPGNCRWIVQRVQIRNRGNTQRVEVDGVSRSIAEWEEISGVNRQAIRARLLRNWDPRKAVFTPTRSAISAHATGGLHFSDHLSAVRERTGEVVGFSESERQRCASSATLQGEGALDMSIVGSSPQGEADTRAVCRLLKDRLNAEGSHWDQVIPGREPADCVLVHAGEQRETIEVQVVRACASQDLWRELNSAGCVQKSLSPADAAAEIRKAIETKARDAKIPRQLRLELVLALDATRLPGLAFDETVHQFRSTHLDWVRSCGFASVWLVGPLPSLVWRLD